MIDGYTYYRKEHGGFNMAKKNNYLLAAAIAGAAAYLRKPENRDKAMAMFNDTKGKVSEFVTQKKQEMNNKQNADPQTGEHTIVPDCNTAYDLNDEKMVSEGSTQATVDYENLEQEKEAKEPSLSANKEELDPEGGIQKQ